MYGWIWQHLPGTFWVKTAVVAGIILATVVILFIWVFPWIAPLLPFQQQTVGE